MKRFVKTIMLPVLLLSLSGCGLFEGLFEKDDDVTHTKSYEPITGKFVLYDALDKRFIYHDTYFEINGSEENFSLKYYENGALKKEGKIQKLLTRADRIGKWTDNLHFNVKVGNRAEHISTYTESFEPLNQFRIIDEYYNPGDAKYYLSELPFVMGTYVREGEKFVEEKPNTNETNYLIPTDNNFTAAINGEYRLDDNHYFYFLNSRGFPVPDGSLYESYFQYYSSELDKPIEGFIWGYTSEGSDKVRRKDFYIRTYRDSVDWGKEQQGRISFYYNTFKGNGENTEMLFHYGEIDFSNFFLNSFTFEHLSRPWTDAEWKPYLSGEVDRLPDNILYEYVGGTYTKVN